MIPSETGNQNHASSHPTKRKLLYKKALFFTYGLWCLFTVALLVYVLFDSNPTPGPPPPLTNVGFTQAFVPTKQLDTPAIRSAPAPVGAKKAQPDPTETNTQNAASKPKAGESLVSDWLSRMNDPQVMAAVRNHEKGKIERQYSALLKQLNLSPENRTAFITLLMDIKMAPNDVAVAMVQKNENPITDTNQYADLVAAEKTQDEIEIKAILGPNGYAAYENFNRTNAVSNTVDQLQRSLSSADNPLSQQQTENLKQLLASTRVGHLTPKIVNTATTFLSPSQHKALEALYIEEQTAAQLKKMQPPPLLQSR